MKHLIPAILLSAVALLSQGCTTPPVAQAQTQRGFDAKNFPKVAVSVSIPRNFYEGYNNQDAEGYASSIENIVQGALLANGFEVAERSEVERVLKEINFQGDSGMTKEQQAKMGEAIGCRGLVVVSLNKLTRKDTPGYNGSPGSTTYTANISAKLLDLKKCTTVWTANINNHSYSDPSVSVDNCTQAIAAALPSLVEKPVAAK